MRFGSRQLMSTPLLPPKPGYPLSARSIRCGERSILSRCRIRESRAGPHQARPLSGQPSENEEDGWFVGGDLVLVRGGTPCKFRTVQHLDDRDHTTLEPWLEPGSWSVVPRRRSSHSRESGRGALHAIFAGGGGMPAFPKIKPIIVQKWHAQVADSGESKSRDSRSDGRDCADHDIL